MKEMNVCRFLPLNSGSERVHILNIVYETQYCGKTENKIDTCYKMAYVMDGSCEILCRGKRQSAPKGSIFFVFPSVPYTITGDEAFRFSYISYIGVQANRLMEQLRIIPTRSVFSGQEALAVLWEDAIQRSVFLPELAAQGVLYYTLSSIGSQSLGTEPQKNVATSAYKMQMVKKYIDDHFSDSTLSLESISKEFAYNKKYLSTTFKQQFKVGINEYLTTVRINHACVLMEQRYTSVKDIAYLCGFSEQLYFSRVFHKKMGVSPREHMKTL